jgi:hypothetical protein
LFLFKPSAWQSDALLKLIMGKSDKSLSFALHWQITKIKAAGKLVLGTCQVWHAPQAHKLCKHHEISSCVHIHRLSILLANLNLRPASQVETEGASFTKS